MNFSISDSFSNEILTINITIVIILLLIIPMLYVIQCGIFCLNNGSAKAYKLYMCTKLIIIYHNNQILEAFKKSI